MSNTRKPKAAKAQPELAAVPDTDDDHVADAAGVEDFDAFMREHRAKKAPKFTTIRGVRVDLPASLPLQFELEARKLQRSKRDQDVRKLVGILLGEGTLDRLAEAGLDLDEFKLLLAWVPQVLAGEPVTLAEVAAQIAEAEAEQAERDGEDADDPS